MIAKNNNYNFLTKTLLFRNIKNRKKNLKMI